MACETHFRDIDVKTSLLIDWQHNSDCLPLITESPSERRNKLLKPQHQDKSLSYETKSSRHKNQSKWKLGRRGTDNSDQEQLISDTSRDDLNDIDESRDGSPTSEKNRPVVESERSRETQTVESTSSKWTSPESDEEKLMEKTGESDDVTFEKSRDYMNGREESQLTHQEKDGYANISFRRDVAEDCIHGNNAYMTALFDMECKPEVRDVATKLTLAEEQVARSLEDAVSVIDDKKKFLLKKLHILKMKKDKDRSKTKAKTPIQVLKSPRASPTPASDSDNEIESVFVRKKVIRTDKRKMELNLMAEIDLILSKAQNIALTAEEIKYMTPCFETKISADVDSDEETPDLVDVLAVTIGDRLVVMTTDFKNSSLKSFRYVHYEVVSSVLKFDNSPWGVTRMDMNTVAVSIPLANKLCLVDASSGLRLVDTVKTKKQYYGIVSIGSSLVVATSPYSNPRSVDTVDVHGAVLKTMVIDTLLQQPSFICSTPSGGFVLSDLSKGALLGVKNTLELGNGFEIGDEAQLQSSRGVTSNQDGDVFVVDYRQKKVKVFSNQGRFIKDFLTSEDTLKYPYGICFDHKGHLFVTDGGVIKIFSY